MVQLLPLQHGRYYAVPYTTFSVDGWREGSGSCPRAPMVVVVVVVVMVVMVSTVAVRPELSSAMMSG